MSELVRRDVRVRAVVAAAAVLITSVLVCRNSLAAQLEQAEITTIIHDVQLLLEQAQPRPAAVKDTIRKGAAVRTGADSRTELMFTDQTLARMGANTIFSFNEGTREMNLGSGVMLVHVPKGAGGAKIVTAGVSAGITGTTLMFEYHRDAYSKMIVLEGLVKVWLNAHPEIVVEVHGGEILMIPPHATKLDDPVAIDLATLVATSPLFTDFTPLPSMALIEEVIREQQQLFADRLNKDLTGLDVRSLVFPLLSTGSNPAPPVGSLITFLSLPAGLWSQPASWTPAIVPNNNGNQTFTAIINGGMITQDILAPGVTIQQLQMNGGTLQLDNPLRLNTGLAFTGGSITGGTLNMAGPSSQAGPMGVQNTVLNNSGTYDFTFQSGFAFTGSPGTSSFSNTGTVRKTNGIDVVIINVPMTNTGTVNVLNGAIEFDGGGANSGTFTGAAGTVVNFASNFSMLNGTRFVGPAGVSFNDGTVTTFAGTISNDTSIFFNSFATFTDFVLNGDVNLTGNGTINVTGFDRILGNGVLTTNNTIQGDTSAGGSIGANQIGISLQGGTIDANTNGLVLDVDPNSANGMVNKGFLRASNGGILQLNGNGGGGFNNSNGSITALDTSEVHLTNGAAITGGSMGTTGSGVIRNLNTASLSNVINNGAFIADDGSTTTVSGTITDNGSILLNSTGATTDLILNGDVTLGGTGTLTMAGVARVLGSGLLTNQITIQGEGSLGNDQIAISNAVTGLINANVSGGTLNIDPINAGTQFGNDGTLRASNGGILLLNGNNGGDFINSGTLEAVSGGALQFTGHVTSTGTVDVGSNTLNISGVNGSYLNTAGNFILRGGTVTSAANLNFQAGLLDAHGTITAPLLTSAATLLPALGGTGLKLNGNLTLLNASNLSFQLGGLTQGSQYSFLNVNGTVGLNGKLLLSFANGFQNSVTGGDTFTITSATSIGGTFTNVTSGGTLATSDGFGSFVVTISGTNITLSGFTAAPISPIEALWTGGSGNWTNPANWNINPNFPNNGQPNGTEIYNATLNSGSITLNAPITIRDFTMGGGNLVGNNTLTLNGIFSWGGPSSIANGVTLNANGGMVFSGGTVVLDASTINLAAGQTATMNAATSNLTFTSNALFTNNGEFLAENDGTIGGTGTFKNNSEFIRQTSSGTFVIGNNVTFTNDGHVTTDTGTLRFNGPVTNNLLMIAKNGGTLRVDGTLTSGGAGQIELDNGTLLVNGTVDANQVIGSKGTITVGATGAFSAVGDLEFNGTHTTTGNGGILDLTAPSVAFGNAAGQINGADFDGLDSAAASVAGGDGGTLTVTATTGDITTGTPQIVASTGLNGPGVVAGGKGGTVTLTANTGTVTIQNKIQVSDNVATRVSAQGGNININSGASGPGSVAINVASSGQLLSLLNAAAPGPGGAIKFVASGAGSKINVQGLAAVQATIQADKGLIDIRQTNSGLVNIGDVTPVLLHGDTIKIAALGTNGQLTIGGGTIDANTLLQLYAPDSSGRVVFVANVTLSGASTKFIAGGTVRINDGVQVNVTGGAAQVFATTAQYSAVNGGNGNTTGLFTGAGAPNSVQPLGGQPVLGVPPVPARPTRR